MKKFFLAAALALIFPCICAHAQSEPINYPPDATYLFAQRDTCDLFMDVYNPAPDSETVFEGKTKPTILWLFGGGFVGGTRSEPSYLPWFKLLNDNGYRVITADYRLGLKGQNMGFGLFTILPTARKVVNACAEIGVQDLFSAVCYILDNADALGVEKDNIVVAGSSAGAMISVTAEWEICNGMPNASALPEGWNFAGVMSFSGAIMSDRGTPSWKNQPCPQLLFHGTADKIVTYKKIQAGKLGIFGSDFLAERLAARSAPYCIVRFEGHGHEIAASMSELWPWEKRWLETNVIQGVSRISDELTDDPTIPFSAWGSASAKDLY